MNAKMLEIVGSATGTIRSISNRTDAVSFVDGIILDLESEISETTWTQNDVNDAYAILMAEVNNRFPITGGGNTVSADTATLPQFQVAPQTADPGQPGLIVAVQPSPSSSPVVLTPAVPTPIYANPWFWIGMIAGSAFVGLGAWAVFRR